MTSKALDNVIKLNGLPADVTEFGALGDNSTNDAPAIQAAVNAMPASGGALFFPSGKTFVLNTPITFAGKSNFTISGYGATIRCGATRITSYFNLDNTSNVNIIGLTFDARVAQMPLFTPADYGAVYNVGVYANSNCADLRVQDCRFVNLYTNGAFIRASANITFSLCVFTSPAQQQNQTLEHLYFLTSSNVRVLNCDFINAAPPAIGNGVCGIFASSISGAGIKIDGCSFDYCGRDNTGSHRLGVIDFYWDVVNGHVTNCVSRNTLAEFMRLSALRKGTIANNHVYIASNAELDGNCLTIQSGNEVLPGVGFAATDITISGNTFDDASSRHAVTIGVFSYDWGGYARNINIENNSFFNVRRCVAIRGPYMNVSIINNVSNAPSTDPTHGRSVIDVEKLSGMTSVFDTEANSFFEGLVVSGNVFRSSFAGSGFSFSFPAPAVTAFLGSIVVSNNVFSDAGTAAGGAGIAISARSTVPANNKVIVSGNTIENFVTAFQLQDSGVVKLHDNVVRITTNELIEGGNVSFSRANNTFRNNPLSGLATLVAGTVTVTGADCSTGDTVMLSRKVAAGTEGHLSVSSVGNGTFTIVSSSATDTSQIHWLVVH